MIKRLFGEQKTKRMLVVFFICSSVSLMGLRWFIFDANRVLPEDSAWKIVLTGKFEVNKGITLIYSAKPKALKSVRIISQKVYHPNLKILPTIKSTPGKTRAKATETGNTEIIYEYLVHISKNPLPLTALKPEMTSVQRENYLLPVSGLNLSLPDVTLLKEFLSRDVNSKPELIHKIFKHTNKLIKSKNFIYNDLNKVITSNKATTLARAQLMVALSRLSDIPARLVTGFILEETKPLQPYFWVEIYGKDNIWQAYDPEKGYEASVPNTYVAFGYDSPNIFNIENGKIISTEFSVSEDIDLLSVSSLEQEKDFFDIFDLRRLDLETKDALKKLLILPFCVLFVAFIRHVLGFFPYGTFTAPLLALAMVYAEMSVTLVIAGIIILLALAGRAILPKSLPRTPRLSLIFTFVAMSMVFSVSAMSYYSMNMGGSIILLPTIILVSVVDRFYSYMDEASPHAALIRLGVTVVIAIFCIPILEFETLGSFILVYPEAHLITAALVLTFSSYKLKKLTDFKHLKLFGENKKVKQPVTKKTLEE